MTISDLILLRLFAAPAAGETVPKAVKDLVPLLSAKPSNEETKRLIENLVAGEKVKCMPGKKRSSRYALTGGGELMVREMFHIPSSVAMPVKWIGLRDRYLTAVALGIRLVARPRSNDSEVWL